MSQFCPKSVGRGSSTSVIGSTTVHMKEFTLEPLCSTDLLPPDQSTGFCLQALVSKGADRASWDNIALISVNLTQYWS